MQFGLWMKSLMMIQPLNQPIMFQFSDQNSSAKIEIKAKYSEINKDQIV